MQFRGRSIRVAAPAPIPATMALVGDLHPFSRLARRVAMLQLVGSETTAFLDDDTGQALAVFGFYAHPPLGEASLFELWLMVRPEAGPVLLPMARFARLTADRLRQHEGIVIRSLVAVGHDPGRKLARIMGLELVGVTDGLECWEWRSVGTVCSDHHGGSDRRCSGGGPDHIAERVEGRGGGRGQGVSRTA